MNPNCGHLICQELYEKSPSVVTNCTVCAIMSYQDGEHQFPVMLVIKEKQRRRQDEGKWGIPSETGESQDCVNGHFCWLRCAARCLLEECKLTSDQFDFLDLYATQAKTPLIYVLLKPGTSRALIRERIRSDNQNPFLPHCFKEVSDVEFIRPDHYSAEGYLLIMTEYLRQTLNREQTKQVFEMIAINPN